MPGRAMVCDFHLDIGRDYLIPTFTSTGWVFTIYLESAVHIISIEKFLA
jgi:hypothetical protein